jgi:hypothetical protein
VEIGTFELRKSDPAYRDKNNPALAPGLEERSPLLTSGATLQIPGFHHNLRIPAFELLIQKQKKSSLKIVQCADEAQQKQQETDFWVADFRWLGWLT